MKCLGLFVAFSVIFLAAPALAEDIIVESRREGQNYDRYKEVEGAWMDSQTPPAVAKSSASGLTDPTKCGSRKFLFSGQNGDIPPLAAARFSPMLAAPGHYYVYATWPRAANVAPVTYTVKHAKGEDKKVLSQNGRGIDGNANSWHLLGDYDFTPSPDQYVEVRIGQDAKRVDASNYGQVYSDAVRFSSQPISDSQAGQTTSAAASQPSSANPQLPGLPNLISDSAPLKWCEDVGAAQSLATQENKKILVLFYSPQSATSKYYEEEVLPAAVVKPLLKSGFVLARISFVDNMDLAYKLGVFKAGMINIYNPQGRALDQISERLTPSEFAERLKKY